MLKMLLINGRTQEERVIIGMTNEALREFAKIHNDGCVLNEVNANSGDGEAQVKELHLLVNTSAPVFTPISLNDVNNFKPERPTIRNTPNYVPNIQATSEMTQEEYEAKNVTHFIIIGNYALYVENLKKLNTYITQQHDLDRMNISYHDGISIENDSMVRISLERFEEGDRDKFVKFTSIHDDWDTQGTINIKDKSSKGLELFCSIPLAMGEHPEFSQILSEATEAIQELQALVGAATEDTFKDDSNYKHMSLMIRSKDLIRTMLAEALGRDIEDKKELISEMAPILNLFFMQQNVQRLSAMKQESGLSITKMKTGPKDPNYTHYDEANNTNRGFIKSIDRTFPITPEAIVNIQPIITSYKAYIGSNLIRLANAALGVNGYMKAIRPDQTIEKYIVANITKEELDDFLDNYLPNAIKTFVDDYITNEAKKGVARMVGTELSY